MADTSSLADIVRQIAFYQNGGRDPGTSNMDQFNKGFNSVANIGETYNNIVKQVLANKAIELENQKRKNEIESGRRSVTPIEITAGQIPSNSVAGTSMPGTVSGTDGEPVIQQQKQSALPEELKPFAKFTPEELPKLAGSQSSIASTGLKQAQTQKIVEDPTRKTLGDLFPTATDEQITKQFGDGISKQTPYLVALGMGKMKQQLDKSQRMFPVSALSPEGQSAARAAGLPDYIPESTARIINGANPIKLPSFEESTSVTTAQSIKDKINQVANLFPEVKDNALGFGKYQINKYGQYIPGVSTDPKISDFYTNINSINNAMIYYMSGKQINEQESKRIKSELLEPELNPDAFAARLNTVIRNFDYLNNLKDQAVIGVGKRNPLNNEIKAPSSKKDNDPLGIK